MHILCIYIYIYIVPPTKMQTKMKPAKIVRTYFSTLAPSCCCLVAACAPSTWRSPGPQRVALGKPWENHGKRSI